MSSNHTPGPWYWLSGGHICTTVGPDWASHEIAEVYDDGPNARLIASAPELYDALRALLAYMAPYIAGDDAGRIAVQKARAALARVQS